MDCLSNRICWTMSKPLHSPLRMKILLTVRSTTAVVSPVQAQLGAVVQWTRTFCRCCPPSPTHPRPLDILECLLVGHFPTSERQIRNDLYAAEVHVNMVGWCCLQWISIFRTASLISVFLYAPYLHPQAWSSTPQILEWTFHFWPLFRMGVSSPFVQMPTCNLNHRKHVGQARQRKCPYQYFLLSCSHWHISRFPSRTYQLPSKLVSSTNLVNGELLSVWTIVPSPLHSANGTGVSGYENTYSKSTSVWETGNLFWARKWDWNPVPPQWFFSPKSWLWPIIYSHTYSGVFWRKHFSWAKDWHWRGF